MLSFAGVFPAVLSSVYNVGGLVPHSCRLRTVRPVGGGRMSRHMATRIDRSSELFPGLVSTMNTDISLRFVHGLGDCSNFAHMIPLYLSRGYTIEVEAAPDKWPIFLAAGAKMTHN